MLERHGGRVDLVITDVLMPFASDDAAHVLVGRPRSAFIAKPFVLSEVAEQIQRLLAG